MSSQATHDYPDCLESSESTTELRLFYSSISGISASSVSLKEA